MQMLLLQGWWLVVMQVWVPWLAHQQWLEGCWGQLLYPLVDSAKTIVLTAEATLQKVLVQVSLWVLKWQGAALEYSRSTRKLLLAQHLQGQVQAQELVLELVLELSYYL